MACQSSTMAGANCFSGHGLLECGLDPRKGTLCRCAAVPTQTYADDSEPRKYPWAGLVAIGAK